MSERERGADPLQGVPWDVVSDFEDEAFATVMRLSAERDQLREIVDHLSASLAAHIAASDEVADIFGRILERGYIDAPANAGALDALKRQAAAKRRQARALRATGRKIRHIAAEMKITERQVYRLLKKD